MRMVWWSMLATMLLAGCNSHPWYRSADAFRDEVSGWSLPKRPVAEALADLKGRGFACDRRPDEFLAYECGRSTHNFACRQNQVVLLELAADRRTVKGFTVASHVSGELPTACL